MGATESLPVDVRIHRCHQPGPGGRDPQRGLPEQPLLTASTSFPLHLPPSGHRRYDILRSCGPLPHPDGGSGWAAERDHAGGGTPWRRCWRYDLDGMSGAGENAWRRAGGAEQGGVIRPATPPRAGPGSPHRSLVSDTLPPPIPPCEIHRAGLTSSGAQGGRRRREQVQAASAGDRPSTLYRKLNRMEGGRDGGRSPPRPR